VDYKNRSFILEKEDGTELEVESFFPDLSLRVYKVNVGFTEDGESGRAAIGLCVVLPQGLAFE